MRRFEKAKEGDLVYCRLRGAGFIAYINIGNDEIRVRFQPGANVYYDCAGRKNSTDIEPILFYRSATDNYLTERPEPEVDWSAVEVGTLIEVCDDLSENDWSVGNLLVYLPQHKLPYWAWSLWDSTRACGFKYARLAKETPTCQKV